MKSLTEHLWFNAKNRMEFINITGKVEELVRKSGVKEGICLVNAMHITASVFINDEEDGLKNDFKQWLEKLAPHEVVSQLNDYLSEVSESLIDNSAFINKYIGDAILAVYGAFEFIDYLVVFDNYHTIKSFRSTIIR